MKNKIKYFFYLIMMFSSRIFTQFHHIYNMTEYYDHYISTFSKTQYISLFWCCEWCGFLPTVQLYCYSKRVVPVLHQVFCFISFVQCYLQNWIAILIMCLNQLNGMCGSLLSGFLEGSPAKVPEKSELMFCSTDQNFFFKILYIFKK